MMLGIEQCNQWVSNSGPQSVVLLISLENIQKNKNDNDFTETIASVVQEQ